MFKNNSPFGKGFPFNNETLLDNNPNILGSGILNGGEYQNITIAGSGIINGNIKCNNCTIDGSGTVNGNIVIDKIFKCAGSINIHGNIVCGHHIDIQGILVCHQIDTDKFKLMGGFSIKELKANQVIINLNGDAEIDSIKADQIDITQDYNNRKILKANNISGQIINIVATQSQEINGRKIVIGSDCTINSVFYSESLEIDNNSTVKNKTKI